MKFHLSIRSYKHNIFLRRRRLFQQFLVKSYVNIQKSNLNWCRNNQKTFKGDQYLREFLQNRANNPDRRVGKIAILPSSFMGSPRYMNQLYPDTIAEVRNSDVPQMFITMTCNRNWPEIQENVLEHQEPSDRLDLIARVFH